MSKLFQSWKIGNLKLNNRIVIAPMCQYSAENGKATSWHLMHLGTLSHSGAGLLILEATAVSPEGRISYADLGLYDDACETALDKVIQEVRKYSTMPIAIQLAHAGRKASTEKSWLGGKQLSPDHTNGWQTVAPSALPFYPDNLKPSELSLDEIHDIKNKFVLAAKRAARIGIQGIEVHAAHGYLMHQFLSPISNKRTDQYGGSLENRMRFVLETFAAVKSGLPENYPLWIRISATDWVDGGWSVADSIVLSKELKKLGCELVHVSSAGLDPNQKIKVEPNYQVSFAQEIKNAAGIETIAVGLITEPEQAEAILQNEQADAIAIARAILYNPRWPWHAAAKLNARVHCPAQFLRSQPSGLNDLLQMDKV